MTQKDRRPTISLQIQCELWARAAGRCEFRGCNKLLYKDGLTQHRSNLSNISHIVAFSPDGPRGDPVRSKLLEKNITNLMLTCRDHSKIMDDKERVAEYSEELLLEFKREHELRIKMVTEACEEAQTHVLLLQVPIDARPVTIDSKAAHRAILPKYPVEENPSIIDLNGLTLPSTTDGFFTLVAQCITQETRGLLRRRPDGKTIKHLSVFALAPVALLVHLGHLLGDIECVELYQRHRVTQDWAWKETSEGGNETEKIEINSQFYECITPNMAEFAKLSEKEKEPEIGLLISISNQVKWEEVKATLGQDTVIYEIRAKDPGFDF